MRLSCALRLKLMCIISNNKGNLILKNRINKTID